MASSIKISYPARLFFWLLSYTVLLAGTFVIFQYFREKEFKAERINTQLQTINTYIISEIEDGHDVAAINLHEFHSFDDIRVSVISKDGNIIYDNSLDSLPKTNHLDRAEIREAIAHGSGFTVRRHSQSTGNHYFYSARLSDDGSIVRTAVPYSMSLSELLKADYGFLWIMGAIAAVMCVMCYISARRIGQHITRLSAFARDVEKGTIISDTEPFPHDELGDISNNIVRLYARLQQALTDRDAEHRKALHQQLEKERIKKQLTNNINHELKTPVAAIRVCLETLLAHSNLEPDKREAFIQRALANTDRLQRLLADVALITRMDDGGASIVKEPVDLQSIINETVDFQRPIAEAKGFAIDTSIDGPMPLVGNASMLETIFHNLIDNAIAYSGGNRISIVAARYASRYVIELSDNGSGVADEHLPRLFERFYRVDKGRSRACGGTGLGLSIVKNAVLLHQGSISAQNRSGGGLIFRITFPSDGDFTKG